MKIQGAWLKNGLKKLEKSVFFTLLSRAFSLSWNFLRRRRSGTTSTNIYRRCSETPLSVFIDCSVDRDYPKLLKRGRASEKKLAEAWSELYSEYSDLTGGQSYKLLLNLSKEIAYLEGKLLAVGLCLRVLAHRPDPRCIKILDSYGYKYRFDPSNLETYEADLKAVIARSGAIQLEITQKRKELEGKEVSVNGKQLTRETYITMLAGLSKHMGFRIDPENTTVSEFVAYRKNYEKEIEAIKKYQEKQNPIPGKSSGQRNI